ncbi:hypothetical protein SAMN04488115_10915 [Bosea lathyri]|uniref:Uncharacterized protein n=1 Tax=Bosea lathyri TaxID=1036778 RepID=A0A1H6C4Y3_9HYPH|nr:hypothetical protein SAMN04488115_10915 [Bosea lathyri]
MGMMFVGLVVMRLMLMSLMIMPVMVMTMLMTVIMALGVSVAVGVAGVVASVMVVAMIIGAALGLERARDRIHRAALPSDHLRQDMVVLDIDRVGRDFRWRVAVADMPGDAHQPQRILGPDFEQALRSRLDQHQPTILQLHGVAIPERGRLVEVEQDIEAAIAFQRQATAIAVLMVERQRLDDLVRPDRSLANDGGGTQHDDEPVSVLDQRRSIDRGCTTSITVGAVTQAPASWRKASTWGCFI